MNKYLAAISSNLVFFGFNTIFFLLITPLAIKVMGDELYGLWAILNAIFLFSSIGTLGMSIVVNKFASEQGPGALDTGAIVSAATLILIPMATIVALILVVLRGWIATQIQTSAVYQAQFEQALSIIALSLYPQFLAKIPQGYLLSQLRNNLMRLVETFTTVAFWTGSVLIAFFSKNLVWIALWALIVHSLSGLVYFIILARSNVLHWRLDKLTLSRMVHFSGFSFIESLSIALYQLVDRIIVGFTLGPAAAGVYSVATSVGLRISMVTGQVSDVMVPYASLKGSLQEYPALLSAYRLLSRFFSLFIALISSLLILWMSEILALWISAEYAQAHAQFFSLMILAYSVISLARPGQQTLDGLGKIHISALVYLASSLSMLVGVYFLSLRLGLTGAALANLFMVGLLSLNAIAYRVLSGSSRSKVLFADIGLGLLLPGMAYLIISITGNWPARLLITILVLGLIGYLGLQDKRIFSQLSQFFNRASNRAFPNRNKEVG